MDKITYIERGEANQETEKFVKVKTYRHERSKNSMLRRVNQVLLVKCSVDESKGNSADHTDMRMYPICYHTVTLRNRQLNNENDHYEC